MKKNIQNKIIFIFVLIEVLIFAAFGYVYVNNISKISATNEIINTSKIYIVVLAAIIVLSSIIFYQIYKKINRKYMIDVVKNAGEIVTGGKSGTPSLNYGNRSRDAFMSAFDDATLELREHLKDVEKQRKQIETILQYMTDGILAFNLEGEVTHKNLAAKRLLNISDEDDDFDKIFSKFQVDINLEKIVYLEDWTSSDKKIKVDDKYINFDAKEFKEKILEVVDKDIKIGKIIKDQQE